MLKDASSVEEVDESNAISEGTPPLVLPREDSGMGGSGEEFQVSIGNHSSLRPLTPPDGKAKLC